MATIQLYCCTTCNKTFTDLDEHLKLHQIANIIIPPNGEEVTFEVTHTLEGIEHIEGDRHELDLREKFCKYTCCYCGKKFMTKFEVDNHERSHTKERPFKCHLCYKSYTAPGALFKHKKKNHPTSIKGGYNRLHVVDGKLGSYVCSVCGKRLHSSDSLKFHERTIHAAEKGFHCPECMKPFRNRGGVYMHMRRVHRKEPAKRKTLLLVDMLTGNGMDGDNQGIQPAVKSENSGEGANGLDDTLVDTTVSKQLEVSESVSSSSNSKLDQNNGKLHQCPYCPKSWKKPSELAIHMRYHTGEKPYVCPECAKKFTLRAELHNHIKKRHDWELWKDKMIPSKKPPKCPYCAKVCRNHCDLNRHMRLHTGERPYKCPECSKAFAVSRSLTHHVQANHDWDSLKDKVHEVFKQQREACADKGITIDHDKVGESIKQTTMVVAQKTNLAVPVGTNGNFYEEGESQSKIFHEYICSFCTIAPFKSNQKRDEHERSHDLPNGHHSKATTPYKYKCSFCDKKWSTRDNRRLHERIHTGEKPIKCLECGMAFRTRGSVYKHLRSVHKKEPILNKTPLLEVQNDPLETGKKVNAAREEDTVETNRSVDESDEEDTDKYIHIVHDYRCSFCSIAPFTSYQKRDEHEKIHDIPNKYNSDLFGTCDVVKGRVRKYKCSFCIKKWLSRGDRRQHERTHTGERPIKCLECGMSFRTRSSVFKHMKCIHKKEPILKKTSFLTVHGGIGNETDVVTKQNDPLDIELEIGKKGNEPVGVLGQKSIVIEDGNGSDAFSSNQPESEHQAQRKDKRSVQIECSNAARLQQSSSKLDVVGEEILMEHNNNNSVSGIDKTSTIIIDASDSDRDVSTNAKARMKKPHKCPYCPKTWKFQCDLVRHVRYHTGERPYKCPECPKAFAVSSSLTYHVQANHDWDSLKDKVYEVFKQQREVCADKGISIDEEREGIEQTTPMVNRTRNVGVSLLVFNCSFCGKGWPSMGGLKLHERTHTREKPYECPECGMAFCSGSAVNEHMRTIHKIEPSLRKPVLGKAGNADTQDNEGQYEENTVETIGNDEEDQSKIVHKYICSFCSVAPFKSYQERDEHERSHDLPNGNDSKVKTPYKYKCSFCDKKWLSRCDRRQHERIHTGEKPIKCLECGMTFRTRGSVFKHMRRIHKKEPFLKKTSLLKVHGGIGKVANVVTKQNDPLDIKLEIGGKKGNESVGILGQKVIEDGNGLEGSEMIVPKRENTFSGGSEEIVIDDDSSVSEIETSMSIDAFNKDTSTKAKERMELCNSNTTNHQKVFQSDIEALKEPCVSVINCEHRRDDGPRHLGTKGKKSHSCLPAPQKVIKINYNGQVRLFTLKPFDCLDCERHSSKGRCDGSETETIESDVTTRPNNKKCQGQPDKDIHNHSYGLRSSTPRLPKPKCQSSLRKRAVDSDHASDIIAHSQEFKKVISTIMIADKSTTPHKPSMRQRDKK